MQGRKVSDIVWGFVANERLLPVFAVMIEKPHDKVGIRGWSLAFDQPVQVRLGRFHSIKLLISQRWRNKPSGNPAIRAQPDPLFEKVHHPEGFRANCQKGMSVKNPLQQGRARSRTTDNKDKWIVPSRLRATLHKRLRGGFRQKNGMG